MLEGVSRFVLNRIYNRSFDSSLFAWHKYFNSTGLKKDTMGIVWGKQFHTDQFACRRSPRPFSPKKKKWLFIGDSVTEGVGVDDSSTFAAIVAMHTDSVNVMNYSLIGYSDYDYLNVLKKLLDNTDSSINKVTICFCLNDVYAHADAADLGQMQRPGILGRINGLVQNRSAFYKVIKLLVYQNADRYFQYDLDFYKSGGYYFQESMRYLKACNDLCKRNGVEMNVVMLPYRSQLVNTDENDRRPQKLVGDFCRSLNIPFSDPIDYCSKTQNPKDLYLFADEIHFSEAGHKMMANYILSH